MTDTGGLSGRKYIYMVKIPEIFGCAVFNDDVMRDRLPKDVYKSLTKTIAVGRPIDPSIAGYVATAMKDMYKKNKDVSIHGLPVKLQVLGVKLLPHKLVMKIWMKQQKH